MGITSKAGIKSIQRGTVSIDDSRSNGTATIAAVNPSKSEVRLTGYENGGTGAVRIRLLNSTTIQANRAQSSGGAIANYEVTEWG